VVVSHAGDHARRIDISAAVQRDEQGHGQAESLQVRLRRDGDLLHVEIEDDGRAHWPLQEGHGLTGMRERIDALGGQLRIARAERGGLRIDASLPA